MLKAFWQEESGLTVVEYAVAGGLIAAAVVVAFRTLGQSVNTKITESIPPLILSIRLIKQANTGSGGIWVLVLAPPCLENAKWWVV